MLERGPRRRRRRHLLPHEPPRPPRLHRRAPRAACPSPASAARPCPSPSPSGRRGSASRRSAPTAAPSTRRSPAALHRRARGEAAHTDGHALPGVEMRLDERRRDLQPRARLLRRLHRPRRSPRRCSTTTAGTAPATSACSTTTATSRSPTACPTSSSAAARTSAPRRSRSCCSASTASPRSAWSPRPTSASASTPPPSCACATAPTPPTLDDVRAHLAAAGLAKPEVARVALHRGRRPPPHAVGQGAEVPPAPAACGDGEPWK